MRKKISTIKPYEGSDTALVMVTKPEDGNGEIEVYNCEIGLLIQAGLLTSTGKPESDGLKKVYEIEVRQSLLGADIITSIRPEN